MNYVFLEFVFVYILKLKALPKVLIILLFIFSEGQIKSRYEKLQKVYNKWEKINFPDQKKKEAAFKILKSQKKENEGSKKNNVNKPKGKKN